MHHLFPVVLTKGVSGDNQDEAETPFLRHSSRPGSFVEIFRFPTASRCSLSLDMLLQMARL
jgi:hypothetical protein